MKIIIKQIRNFYRILYIYFNDFISSLKYIGFYKDTSAKIPWRIMLLSHSIEKGLSIPNKKNNFGEEKAKDLLRYLNLYEVKDDFVFLEGISVLKAYIEYRKENNLSYKEFESFNNVDLLNNGGIIKISKEEVKYDFENFKKLTQIRHSVREYDDKYVDAEKIKKALSVAITAPSACNRQMIKVYYSNSIEKNNELAEIIPGNNGFKKEKATYIFLTADRNAFDYFEIDQWYLNGGIFLAYLQLAFAAEQIGSCIYQWPKNKKIEQQAKKILEIPNNEIIVSVLGIGNYKEEFNVLKATKKEVDDISVCN